MWTCSACGRPIADYEEGILIADDIDDRLINWRVVHHISCDTDQGPWHPLIQFIGKRGRRNFESMRRIGAFSDLTTEDIDALREAVVRADYKQTNVQRTTFAQWLRQQTKRDDPIGDLARDFVREPLSNKHNPSLRDCYLGLVARGATGGAVEETLIEAYRDWQSFGNTYRESEMNRKAQRNQSRPTKPNRQNRPAAPPKPKRVPKPPKPLHLRDGWLTLRFRILKRDGYRCQMCGRNAKEHGIVLEVDHIIPRAKGGTDDPSNLWTLCFDCNRGKRDSDL